MNYNSNLAFQDLLLSITKNASTLRRSRTPDGSLLIKHTLKSLHCAGTLLLKSLKSLHCDSNDCCDRLMQVLLQIKSFCDDISQDGASLEQWKALIRYISEFEATVRTLMDSWSQQQVHSLHQCLRAVEAATDFFTSREHWESESSLREAFSIVIEVSCRAIQQLQLWCSCLSPLQVQVIEFTLLQLHSTLTSLGTLSARHILGSSSDQSVYYSAMAVLSQRLHSIIQELILVTSLDDRENQRSNGGFSHISKNTFKRIESLEDSLRVVRDICDTPQEQHQGSPSFQCTNHEQDFNCSEVLLQDFNNKLMLRRKAISDSTVYDNKTVYTSFETTGL